MQGRNVCKNVRTFKITRIRSVYIDSFTTGHLIQLYHLSLSLGEVVRNIFSCQLLLWEISNVLLRCTSIPHQQRINSIGELLTASNTAQDGTMCSYLCFRHFRKPAVSSKGSPWHKPRARGCRLRAGASTPHSLSDSPPRRLTAIPWLYWRHYWYKLHEAGSPLGEGMGERNC